jgi:intein/homing endonuclease
MPEQLITMADRSTQQIKNILIGDMVMGWDPVNKKLEKVPVETIMTKEHSDVFEVTLEDGRVLSPTSNHPFLIRDKDWCTIGGYKNNHAGGDGKIEIGDYVYDVLSGLKTEVKITKIEAIPGTYLTYNFIDTKFGNIIAEGIITHNSR